MRKFLIPSLVVLLILVSFSNYAIAPETCTDSDGGENYYVKGTAQYSWQNESGEMIDKCILVPDYPENYTEVESCDGPDCFLNEVECIDGNPTAHNYHCPNGCEEGACIGYSHIEVLAKLDGTMWEGPVIFDLSQRSDFDGLDATGLFQVPVEFTETYPEGMNVYIRYREEEGFQSGPEGAYLDSIIASCGENGNPTAGPCPAPASFTFEFRSAEAECYDSDGGENYYVKGTVTGYANEPPELVTHEDCCIVSTDQTGKCVYEGDRLVERYCEENYWNSFVYYDCPNGCKDGACIEKMEFCGNGVCEIGETWENCPEDCERPKCPEKIDLIFNKYEYYPGDYFEVKVKIYDSSGNLMPNQVFNVYNEREGQTTTFYTDSSGIYVSSSTVPSDPKYNGEWTFIASVSEEGCWYVSDKETIYIKISNECGDGYCDEHERELICETVCALCPVPVIEAQASITGAMTQAAAIPTTQQLTEIASPVQECGCTTFCHVKCPDDCTPNCGNGVCDTVVCEAEGCPIPENEKNCPQDCKRPNYCGPQSSDLNCICQEGYIKERFEAPCSGEIIEDINVIKGYRNAYWQCYDGMESHEGGETSCKSPEIWKRYATDFCEGHCNDYGKCGVSTFEVWNECGGTSEMCTYYRCVPAYSYINLFTNKYSYDLNEPVEIYTNPIETGDLELREIEVSVKKPYGDPVIVTLKAVCETEGICPECPTGYYCPPCKTFTICKYTGTFTGTDTVGHYSVSSTTEREDMVIHPTSFRVYDYSLLERYLILKDINGYIYKDAQLSPGPENAMGYMANYEKGGRGYAVIVADFETREDLEKFLNTIFQQNPPSEEKIGEYYVYVFSNYGVKVYVWTYKTFMVGVTEHMPIAITAEVVKPVPVMAPTKTDVIESIAIQEEEVAVTPQKAPEFLTGMIITGMPVVETTTVYCGMDSLYPQCICRGDEIKEEFTPPCAYAPCEKHYRCKPPYPKELLAAYLDRYPSDVKATGTECEDMGGYCIHFESSCKTGFEETRFACKTRSEKCCIREVDRDDFLEIVMKLEGIRVKMDKLERKARALSEYYDSVDDEERAKKFSDVAGMFAKAKEMIDDIIAKIRVNLDNLEAIRSEVKEDIYELRTYISSILGRMVS